MEDPENSLSKNEILYKFENSKNKDTLLRPLNIFNVIYHFYINKVIEGGLKKPFDFDMFYKVDPQFLQENSYPSFKKYLDSRI